MRFKSNGRAATPVLGNLLLVAVVLVLGITVTTLAFTFLESTGTPTAEATFETQQTAAGIELVPTTLGQPVTIQLNGRDIQTVSQDDVGEPVLLPTAPGDRITVLSRDGDRSLLLEETVDERSEVGDFIAYYTFESGSGTTVVDRSRNDNDGSLEDDGGGSGPTWVSGGGQQALSFDGVDDHVFVSDITTGGVDSVSSFTVATTVTFDGETGSIQQFVEHRSGSDEWFLETADTTAPFGVSYAVRFPDQVVASGQRLEVGERYVVVGTYDGDSGEYTLYIDGTPVASDTFDRDVQMGALRLGRDYESANQYFDGRLSELRLYYTAFDDREVATLTEVMSG